MLLDLKRLDGKTVVIDSSTIFRLRPAIKSLEPNAVAVVHYDRNLVDKRYQTLASKQSIKSVVKVLRTALPMVKLTSPSGGAVFIDAFKVVEIAPAGKEHFKGAKAVVHVLNQQQQVAETVAKTKKMINRARDDAA